MTRRKLATLVGLPLAGLVAVLAYLYPRSSLVDRAAQPGRMESVGGRHALLVGVSKYPSLDPGFELFGPPNDVLLMSGLLQTQFKFPKENIAILAEDQDPDRWPTRANIKAAFEKLAKDVKPGEQVVILLSGHGSQQPEDPNSKDPEPDGLDEIFLPRDVGKWDAARNQVTNAIINREFGSWLDAIRANQGSVWIIFDCCHAGNMKRAIDERVREAEPKAALGIPAEALQKARALAGIRDADKPAVRSRGGRTPMRPHTAIPGGIVAFYACQDDEVTVELPLPQSAKDARPHGLFTFTLTQALARAAESSSKPLTYKELAQRIQADYVSLGRKNPTPLIDGKNDDRDSEILGGKVWPGRSNISFANDNGLLSVDAGAIHGLTEGTILAVYPAAGQKNAEEVLGQVKVTTLKTLSATVEPCDDKDMQARELPREGRCQVVSVDYGSQRLKVALDPYDDCGKPLVPAEKQRLEKELANFGKDADATLELVADPAQADWLVRLDAGMVFLLPAAEWSTSARRSNSPLFGPYPKVGNLMEELTASLETIARAEALKRLAAAPADDLARSSGGDRVKLKMELARLCDEDDEVGIPVIWQSEGLVLHDGDRVSLRLRNESPFKVDVTILYVDSNYGISGWFPKKGKVNRIPPGGPLAVPTFRINTKTVGMENVVIIAVKAEPDQPMDFTFLAQSPLIRKRDATKKNPALDTPLGKLCDMAVFGNRQARSVVRRSAIEEYSLHLLPWRIEPTPRPK